MRFIHSQEVARVFDVEGRRELRQDCTLVKGGSMDEDDLSDEDFEAMIRRSAARRAQAIIMREGAALAMSAREMDEDAIAADSQILAIAIAQAIVDAYAGDIDGNESEEPGKPVPS